MESQAPLSWHASAPKYSVGEQYLLCRPENGHGGSNGLRKSVHNTSREAIQYLPPRWPIECQVVEEAADHLEESSSELEEYYSAEVHTSSITADDPEYADRQPVFSYTPQRRLNSFSKSCTQALGSAEEDGVELLSCTDEVCDAECLRFESRFESGNLEQAVRVGRYSYELRLRRDLYTARHTAWFYFQVQNVTPSVTYRFSVVNLSRGWSMYSSGLRPVMYSVRSAVEQNTGWRRVGTNMAYHAKPNTGDDVVAGEQQRHVLSFGVQFPHDRDTVYLASGYPYTFSALQQHLLHLQTDPFCASVCHQRILCRSMAGNPVFLLTITAPEPQSAKSARRAVVLTARVHPGETQSSWMMRGVLDFLTSHSPIAELLRERYVFKVVPMMNPDGVIVGNTRCSLSGRDMNRQFKHTLRDLYPAVWHLKLLVRRLLEENGVSMYCDFHGHSRRQNAFIYGCENRRASCRYLTERVFPYMLAQTAPDMFDWESCLFSVHKSKEGTGRAVMWSLGISNSYTLEASLAGTSLPARSGAHFRISDYRQLGHRFLHALLQYTDQSPQLHIGDIDQGSPGGDATDEMAHHHSFKSFLPSRLQDSERSRVMETLRQKFGASEVTENADSTSDDSDDVSPKKDRAAAAKNKWRSNKSQSVNSSKRRGKPSTSRTKSRDQLSSSSSGDALRPTDRNNVLTATSPGGRRSSVNLSIPSRSRSMSLTSSPGSDAPHLEMWSAGCGRDPTEPALRADPLCRDAARLTLTVSPGQPVRQSGHVPYVARSTPSTAPKATRNNVKPSTKPYLSTNGKRKSKTVTDL